MGCSGSTNKYKKIKEIGDKSNIYHSYLIRSIETKEEYTYKMINVIANKKDKKNILNEIQILKKFRHPNIIQLKSAYYSPDKNYLNIITEYADGGDLQIKYDEQKQKKEYFKEETLLNWFMQICLALKYLHKKNIIHRDIKPSNILLMKQDSEDFAKLGDFGLAKILDSPLKYTKTLIDTPQYGAPEILEKKPYSFKVDIWSLGLIFYQLVILDYPFEGITNEEMQNNIIKGKKKEIPKDCNNFDPKFIELLNEMLSLRPDERPTAEEILKKPILNIRMIGYLNENEFDIKKSNLFIEQYKKNKDNNDSNEEIRVNVFDEFDDEIKINEESIKKAEEKRLKRIGYDFNRQMTYIDEIIKKINTFPKEEEEEENKK